jgi:hypothetical protein
MRKISTFILLALLLNVPMQAQFVSEGNKILYTFESLSDIADSGVTKNGDVYEVTNDITISPTDLLRIDNNITVKLGDGVLISIEGQGAFAPTDTATFTRLNDEAAPKGIDFKGDMGNTIITNITFEYGGLRLLKAGDVIIRNSTFKNINKKLNSGCAVSLGNNTRNDIRNCYFISNEGSAIQSAANFNASLTFKDNYLYDNNTGNTNAPQINVSCINDVKIIIAHNTIIGAERNMVGGIGVSNFMGAVLPNQLIEIDNNFITKCRYGFTTTGPVRVAIRNNDLIDNKYEANPMNGGSGISLYDPYQLQTAVITGNLITDNFWGITVIGCKDVNIGNLDKGPNYNPGLNTFKDNGFAAGWNGFTLFDVCNNGASTVYAQGNTWNVAVQDSVSIEGVVYHKNDDPALGEVIFMPPAQETSIAPAPKEVNAYFDSVSKSLVINEKYSHISIYNSNGSLVLDTDKQKKKIVLPNLTKGIYLAKITNETEKFVLKFVY